MCVYYDKLISGAWKCYPTEGYFLCNFNPSTGDLKFNSSSLKIKCISLTQVENYNSNGTEEQLEYNK